MLAEQELKKLYSQLGNEIPVQLRIDDLDIVVRTLEESSKLSISTQVYFGGNFIPKSVRRSLEEKPSFIRDHIKTVFTTDEENFSIYLHYIGRLDSLHNARLPFLLDEFSWLANQWRHYLDDHDRNDLVYIKAK